MKTSSMKSAMADAEKDYAENGPADNGGTRALWEADTYHLEIVAANYKPAKDGFDQAIGIQAERSTDGKRTWFDLKFPDIDSLADDVTAGKLPEEAFRKKKTMLNINFLKVKALGLSQSVDIISDQFPGDDVAQYNTLATHMIGIKFQGEVSKNTKFNKNYLNKVTGSEGPTNPAASTPASGGGIGLSGGLLG